MVEYWYLMEIKMPFIFRTHSFDRYVVTHFLANTDFHGHRPIVKMNECLLWCSLCFQFDTLTHTFGSSHIANPAYQTWPTQNVYYTTKTFKVIEVLFCPFIV